jgi:hypothetical protein
MDYEVLYKELLEKHKKLENDYENAADHLIGSLNQRKCSNDECNRIWINVNEWCSQCSSNCCYDECCSSECQECNRIYCKKCVNEDNNLCYRCKKNTNPLNHPKCKYQYIHGNDKGSYCNCPVTDINQIYCENCSVRPEVNYKKL